MMRYRAVLVDPNRKIEPGPDGSMSIPASPQSFAGTLSALESWAAAMLPKAGRMAAVAVFEEREQLICRLHLNNAGQVERK